MARIRQARPRTENGGDAISRILQAEQDAERAVADAHREADEIVVRARRRAAEIAERADQRVTSLNSRCAEMTAQRIGALYASAREQEALSQRPLPDGALDAAACAVADWLLGVAKR